MTPKISLIMPVYEADRDLKHITQSMSSQTLADYEVILIPVGIGSWGQETEPAGPDRRFRWLVERVRNEGTAWNLGLEAAKGEYVVFCRGNNRYEPAFCEDTTRKADLTRADLVACHFFGYDGKGKTVKKTGIHTAWLPSACEVFSYRQCPLNILRITTSGIHNKIYRRSFLLEQNIRFDELEYNSGLSFGAVAQASARRISFVAEYLVSIPLTEDRSPEALEDLRTAVDSAVAQMKAMPHWEHISDAVSKFVVEQYLSGLREIKAFSAETSKLFYTGVHETFRGLLGDLLPEQINNRDLYRQYLSVRKHDYRTMREMTARRLIVSVTTYPGRIHLIPQVLETIYGQTRKADEIILWLAREQFPGGEEDLPEQLRLLIAEGKLTLRWCDDLKAHKKYFYALQEFSEDLIVTIDDDLLYPSDMLAALYDSYLLYPDAVSTVRAHLMMFGPDHEILPYGSWIQETDSLLHTPSMQLMATGGAGVLYPPGLFRKEFFDAGAIRENCLWADDLWLKAMAAVSDVPVVLARRFEPLKYLPDSQEGGLVVYNVQQRQNDVQMANIISWLDRTFEPGILKTKLTQTRIGTRILELQPVAAHLDQERKNARRLYLQTCAKLDQTENLRKEGQKHLNQARDEIRQLNRRQENLQAEIDGLQRRKAELQRQITQTEQALQRSESKCTALQGELVHTKELLRQEKENAPIGRQLKALGRMLAQQKAEGHGGIGLACKYLLYGLAWIPEKLLAGTMFFLKNGGKQTITGLLNRVFRRKNP